MTRLVLFLVQVPEGLAKQIQELADERDKSVAVVLRQALREHVERESRGASDTAG